MQNYMIKRFARVQLWRKSPIVILGVAVLIAYLSAISHTPAILADTNPLPTVCFTHGVYTVAENQGTAAATSVVSWPPAPGPNVLVSFSSPSRTAQESAGGG